MALFHLLQSTFVKYWGCITKVLANIFPYKVKQKTFECCIYHSKVGTFEGLFKSRTFVYALSISRENFHDSSKIHENCESFLMLNFCCLQYACIMNELLAIDCGNASRVPHTSNKIFPLLY